MRFVLRLEASRSLKEKRFVVKSVKERLRQRFNVALAEVGEQDNWRMAEIAVVTVAGDRVGAEREANRVLRFLDQDGRFEIVDRQLQWF